MSPAVIEKYSHSQVLLNKKLALLFTWTTQIHHTRRFFALVNIMNSRRNNMSLAGHTSNNFPSNNRKVFMQLSVIEQEACFTIYKSSFCWNRKSSMPEAAETHAVSWLWASTFKIHFFGTLGGLTLGAPTAGNREDEQYHGSYNGNKDSLGPTSTSSPPAVASVSGIATPAVLTSPEPSGSSPSALTHRTRDVAFPEIFFLKEKRKRVEEYSWPPQEAREVMGFSLTCPKSATKERKTQFAP